MAPTVLSARYRLEELLGRGGMGSVWRATDERLARPVAVKLVDLDTSLDPVALERFRREALLTASLGHPNVVTVHDAGADGRSVWLVMELLPGPSLAEVVAQGPLPTEAAMAYGQQICAGLGAAHAAGIVHRDLKPANAVLGQGHLLKVVDFGIARVVGATTSSDLTAPATLMGTPSYVSPEQITGAEVDERADLYALGCVLFALLAGHPPFMADTPLQTLGQHLHAQPPDLAALRPDVPAGARHLVGSLLAKNPAARPASAAEVAEQLSEVQAAGATTATTVAWTDPRRQGRDRSLRRTRRVAGLLGALVAVALVGGILALALGDAHGRPAAPPSPRSTTTATEEPSASSTTTATTTTTTGQGEDQATTPSGPSTPSTSPATTPSTPRGRGPSAPSGPGQGRHP